MRMHRRALGAVGAVAVLLATSVMSSPTPADAQTGPATFYVNNAASVS